MFEKKCPISEYILYLRDLPVGKKHIIFFFNIAASNTVVQPEWTKVSHAIIHGDTTPLKTMCTFFGLMPNLTLALKIFSLGWGL